MKIILLAIRTLLRFRLYTAINILGLAFSLACCILISRYIYGEMTTDHFIPDVDRVCYTVMEDEVSHQKRLFGLLPEYGYEPNPLDDPAVEIASTLFQLSADQITVGNKLYNVSSLATDTNYLKIVPVPIIKSTGKKLLSNPKDAAISENLAQLLFGEEDPLGRQITTSMGEIVTVSAILGQPDTRFSMPFDLLISNESADYRKHIASQSLLRLHKGNSVASVNKKYGLFHKIGNYHNRVRINLYSLQELYFDRQIVTHHNLRLTGNYTHILILTTIDVLIMLIGLFNFINVYTVLIQKRAREFGMKKAFGANSRQVAVQLYAENMCMTCIALFLAWVLIEIGTMMANTYLTIHIPSHVLFDTGLSVGILFVLPLITAIYPFFQYNYASPITSLKMIGRCGESTVSRKIFLCLQYIITLALTVVSIYAIRQLNFMLNTDPGYKTNNIIKISSPGNPIGSDMSMWNKYNQIAHQLDREMDNNPSLIKLHCYSPGPISRVGQTIWAHIAGKDWQNIGTKVSNENFFRILGIEAIEGRLWNNSDDDMDLSIVINESAKKQLGITDINTTPVILDHLLVYSPQTKEQPAPRYKVIGVIKDICTQHLSKGYEPIIYFLYNKGFSQGMLVSLVPEKKQEAIDFLQKIYSEACGNGLSYTFLKDEVQAIYKEDKQLVGIASFFAVIAILISSMGLFSLSLFDIQQRFHEISIRKINGATAGAIWQILLVKYGRLYGIACLISLPLSWLAITLYMVDFVYKVSIAWWIFAAAILLTGGISFLTLVWQIQKAARTNPIDIIRSE
ncbi:ABC transporter permease [uncultured Parabacteroides sp.]|uniref:ABC transporter permease n=1 Tax=uncultured Parabacteroides sp. TaxID=512312 RepID=UPI00259BF137|nr:ABC transporter permease [uncultured Parabacteroides sp.]